MQARILFVTGTDTGVGKTTLTALLLAHLRQTGAHALAMKPFCSGTADGWGDVELLGAIQEGELKAREINPFFFPEPLAPLVAARKHGKLIRKEAVIKRINEVANRCECLLIEGAGGLLAPLGEGYNALDLIQELKCRSIVVAGNRLGTLNHTLLTVNMFKAGRG